MYIDNLFICCDSYEIKNYFNFKKEIVIFEMGKEQSKPSSFDLSINHPKFSNGRFIVNEKVRHMQTVMGVDNKEYDRWKENLAKFKPSSRYLLLPIKEEFSSKGLCGTNGSLTLDFPDFPYLLTQQIINRKGKKRIFEENQLWYLLFALLEAKKSMNPSFSKIGDVRPQNIFINDQSEVKIANIFSWPHEGTNVIKAIDNEVTFLAPQQLRKLQQGGGLNSDSSDHSELFSIGLTLLSAISLEDFSSAYDIKKFHLNSSKIHDKLNQFILNRAYSDIFKGVVSNLCHFEPQQRVLSEEIYNWILPHEEKIVARENFFIPSAPEKIHNQVLSIRNSFNLFQGNQPVSQLRQISVSGQKLNFPPPIVRKSVPEHEGYGFSNPLVYNAQSTYIPSSKITGQVVTSNLKPAQNNFALGVNTDNFKASSNSKIDVTSNNERKA